MSDADKAAPWDRERVLAVLREGGEDREAMMGMAYAMTFGTELGRVVLMDVLERAGVGALVPVHVTDAQLRYQVGRMNAAIELAGNAGLDQAAIAAAIIEGQLEESRHDRSSSSDHHDDAGGPGAPGGHVVGAGDAIDF